MLPNHSLESKSLNISIPWDTNTFRGFVGAIILTSAIFLLLPYFVDFKADPPREERRSIPTQLITSIIIGEGDGTGARKGNGQTEGAAVKGSKPQNPLEDAQIASTVHVVNKPATADYTPGAAVKPGTVTSNTPSKDSARANSSRSIGTENGSVAGNGMGDFGGGTGKGTGIGEIEWGGGGNRVLMNKVIPKMPPGANTSTTIKIKFTVRPDGTVGAVIPMQKGGSLAYEQAAMTALRQWRFNPLTNMDQSMTGTISFHFRVQ